MAHPQLLLLDEPSLGLAPFLVREIFQIIKRINEEQTATIMLVEQNANMALQIAHYGYVMENGKIMMEDEASRLRENPDVNETISRELTHHSIIPLFHYSTFNLEGSIWGNWISTLERFWQEMRDSIP